MIKLTVAEVRELVAEAMTILANGIGLPPGERKRVDEICAALTKTTDDDAVVEKA